MVYKGKTADRGPSFPLSLEDHQKVNRAIKDLLEKHKADSTQNKIPLSLF
jgi:hypothetical protein